ncbi:MAG: hypothetical protein KME26_10320 [Oscillatoria princeps RMCB-10]|jgi:hypothetical protein|nr:hypothetical protein [Oscillatoria princeps RMCB-10]
MQNIPDKIQEVKDKLPNVTPTSGKLKPEDSAHDLKARLEWGGGGGIAPDSLVSSNLSYNIAADVIG